MENFLGHTLQSEIYVTYLSLSYKYLYGFLPSKNVER